MRRCLFGWALCCGLTLFTPSVSAQPQAQEEARLAFEAGRDAYERGDFEAALRHFERSYEITREPDILYNIGTVHDRLRDDAAAIDAFESYLVARPDATEREHIEARIRALRASISRGQHPLEGAETTPDEPPADAGTEHVPDDSLFEAGLALAISGGVLVVGGAILGGVAQADIDSVAHGTRWVDVAGAYDRVPILSGLAIAAILTGAVAAGIGFVLFTAVPHDERVEAVLTPNGLAIRGSF